MGEARGRAPRVRAIWGRRIEHVTALSEIAGYKSGLALTREEIADHLGDDADWVAGDDDAYVRIRAEEFAESVRFLLFRPGAIPRPDLLFPGIDLWHRYRKQPSGAELYSQVMDFFHESYPAALAAAKRGGAPVDLTDFVIESRRRFGVRGGDLALEFVEELILFMQQDPFTTNFRRVDWVDVVELADLFRSEKLDTHYGTFLDQRFIDYLYRNFRSIDEIHWRKFEGLAAEFFSREGLGVQLGPGRGDDGIDIRVWTEAVESGNPPALLVQCKRQKDKSGRWW